MARIALITLLIFASLPTAACANIARVAVNAKSASAFALAPIGAVYGTSPNILKHAIPDGVAFTTLPSVLTPAIAVPGAAPNAAVLNETPAETILDKTNASPNAPDARFTVKPALSSAARESVRLRNAPGKNEQDYRRADFTLARTKFSKGDTAVAAASPAPGRTNTLRHGLSAPRSPPEDFVPPPDSLSESPEGARAFLFGTFFNQLANSTLQVILPIALLETTGSLGMAAMGAAATGWIDTGATALGGYLSDKWNPKQALVAAVALRTAATAGVAVVLTTAIVPATGLVPALLTLFAADALGRGMSDTSRRLIPLTLAGKNEGPLRRLNARFNQYAAAGAWAGPLITGLAMAGLAVGGAQAASAVLVMPFGFAAATFLYSLVKGRKLTPEELSLRQTTSSSLRDRAAELWKTLRKISGDPVISTALIATGTLALMSLKGVLPTIFAEQVLGQLVYAPWLLLAIGAGKWIGATFARKQGNRLTPAKGMALAAAGTLALAAGWIGSIPPLIIGALVLFAASNIAARVVVDTLIQTRTPAGIEGRLVGLQRFASNLIGDLLKTGVAAAFLIAATPVWGLWIVAGALSVFSAANLFLSLKFKNSAPKKLRALGLSALAAGSLSLKPHHQPGRLIVFEGTKSSVNRAAIYRIKQRLEEKRIKVVVAASYDSPHFADTIAEAEKNGALSPDTRVRAYALDMWDQWTNRIGPALAEGAVVLVDRYVFDALARAEIDDVKRRFSEKLYESLPAPDAVYHIRSEKDSAREKALARYGLRHGFIEIDGTGKKKEIAKETARRALTFLNSVDSLKHLSKGPRPNSFDRNPAEDRADLIERFKDPVIGLEDFCRKSCRRVLEAFIRIAGADDLDTTPRTVLHGNPNVGNFAITEWGTMLMDFDRTRQGPYSWDVVRFLSDAYSLHGDVHNGFLHPAVLERFRAGYLAGARNPDVGMQQPALPETADVAAHERSVRAYVVAEGKWVKKMRKFPIKNPTQDKMIASLLRDSLTSVGRSDILENFYVAEAGQDQGEVIGERARDRIIFLLKPKNEKSREDWRLMSFKRIREDDYHDLPVDVSPWFHDTLAHHGRRMSAASKIYNPLMPLPVGYASYDGLIYYSRPMPLKSVKFEGRMLTQTEMRELAFAFGAQLGRGHSLGLIDAQPEELTDHFEANYLRMQKIAKAIIDQAKPAHRRYLKSLRRLKKQEKRDNTS